MKVNLKEDLNQINETDEILDTKIQESVIENVIYENILLFADKIILVKSFLLSLLLRRRFLKLRKSSLKIQKTYRMYRAKKLLK